MFEQIESQMKELASRIEQSLANHNFLLGAKAALEGLYASMKADAPAVEAVIAAVAPEVAPEVDAGVAAVESVVNE